MKPSCRCFVYVMERDDGWCKIGISENPKRRKSNLGTNIEICRTFMFGEVSYLVETTAHRLMGLSGHDRVRNEWFKASSEICIRNVLLAKKAVDADFGEAVKAKAHAKKKTRKKDTCSSCGSTIKHKMFLDRDGKSHVCHSCWRGHMFGGRCA